MGDDRTFGSGNLRITVGDREFTIADRGVTSSERGETMGCFLIAITLAIATPTAVLIYAYSKGGWPGVALVSIVLLILVPCIIAFIRSESAMDKSSMPAIGNGVFRRSGSDMVVARDEDDQRKELTIAAPAALAYSTAPAYDDMRAYVLILRMSDGVDRVIRRGWIDRDRRVRQALERTLKQAAAAVELPFLGRVPMPADERPMIDLD